MQPFVLTLFGLIGIDITSAGIRAQLDLLPSGTPLLVQINSDGGSVAEATAIYNMLRAWPGGGQVEIMGWALSAATMVAMAFPARRAHETAMLMVHAPWTDNGGNEQQLRESADTLRSVGEGMRLAYAVTGQAPGVIASWLDGKDHWFTAAEALAAGLITEVINASAYAAAPVNVYACRHPIPSAINERLQAMPATSNPNPAAPGNADAIRAEGIRIEAQRRGDIRAQFEPFANRMDIAAELRTLQAACENDVSCGVQDANNKILALLAKGVTSAAGGGYTGHIGNGSDRLGDFRAAATDVLMMRAGLRVAEPHPATKDLQRMSLVAMAERMLGMVGVSTRDLSKSEIIARFLTTSDFPSLLSNLAGKSLRDGYESAPNTFAAWTAERDVPDFKPQTLVALSEAPSLLRIVEGGEYKHGSMQDSASQFQVEAYGRMLILTRQAMVNDDLSAFTNLPKAFGNSARRLEAKMVYDLLNSNPLMGDGNALFSVAHGNLAAAGSAPTIEQIGLGRQAMRKQKDISGLHFIDPKPRFIIVPVALETQVEQLLKSLLDPDKTMKQVTNLDWVRGLELVSDPRLDESSPIAWYLASDPKQIEGITRAYLQGEDRPHIEEEAGFDIDSLKTKARLDIGVGVIDYRGLYKNPGA